MSKYIIRKGLKREILPNGNYWLEQNLNKQNGKWTKLALNGHKIFHLMYKTGGYAGYIRIDNKIYDYETAERSFNLQN